MEKCKQSAAKVVFFTSMSMQRIMGGGGILTFSDTDVNYNQH